MTDRLRELMGVLAGVAVLLLMLVFCTDDVGSTSTLFLSAPVPEQAPVPTPLAEAERPPWSALSISLETPWQAILSPTAAAAGAVVATPQEIAPRVVRSEHPLIMDPRKQRKNRRGLFGWLKRRKPDPRGSTELERAPEPPSPDSLRRATRGLQFGIRF